MRNVSGIKFDGDGIIRKSFDRISGSFSEKIEKINNFEHFLCPRYFIFFYLLKVCFLILWRTNKMSFTRFMNAMLHYFQILINNYKCSKDECSDEYQMLRMICIASDFCICFFNTIFYSLNISLSLSFYLNLSYSTSVLFVYGFFFYSVLFSIYF